MVFGIEPGVLLLELVNNDVAVMWIDAVTEFCAVAGVSCEEEFGSEDEED